MITKHKKEYGLNTSDSADYFMESLFVMFIKLFLCIALIYNEKISVVNTSGVNTSNMVTTCLILSCIILHLSLVATLRNGVNMMKFVVFHSEEFQNPLQAFFLGTLICILMVVIETTSLLFQIGRYTVVDIISKFVQFKIMV